MRRLSVAQKDDKITQSQSSAHFQSSQSFLTPNPLQGFLFVGIHQMECPIIAEVWHFSVQVKYLRTLIKMPITLPDLEKFSLGSPRYEALELQCFENHCSDLAFYHWISWNRERRYFIFLSIFSFACPPLLIRVTLNFRSIASEKSLLISFEASLTQNKKENNDKMSKINLGRHHGILSNTSFQSPWLR